MIGFAVVGGVVGLSVLSGCSSGSSQAETLVDSGNGGSHADAGTPTKDSGTTTAKDVTTVSCTPNAQQCATPAIAEVCNTAGTAWIPSPCASGETCTLGVCGSKVTTPDSGTKCTAGATQCLNATTAEVCQADGTWLGVACATGQSCGASGVCGGDAGPACTPNAANCVSSTLARVCPADGSGWLAVECASGQVCANGACVLQLDAPCTAGQGSCTTDTTGFVCNTAGTAYEPVTCPTNTTCMAGNCFGAVEVGSSQCTGINTIATSPDGFTYTQSVCPAGTLCVTTGATTAACLAGNCTPDLTGGGCDSVCGNQVDPSANQADYMSTCIATPNGYEWVAVQCPSPSTCDPTGATCGTTGTTPAPTCAEGCAPGSSQCAPDGSGVQTCSAQGTWGKALPCSVVQGYVCGSPAAGEAFCGDPLCLQPGVTGTCTPGGLFQACNSQYQLEAASAATACPTGETCQITPGSVTGAVQPGACTQTCTPGSSSCIAGGVAQCGADGTWGTPVQCTGSDTCEQYTAASGASAAVCGVCTPGTHQCSPGSAAPGTAPDIQTCGDNGKWSAAAACQIGTCQLDGTDYGCVAECVAGAKTCSPDGTQITTCTASSTYGTFTSCASGESCRVDSNGNAIGCIQCLGPDHGLPPDQECTTSHPGVPGDTDLDTCGANDTWGTPVKCGAGQTCGEGVAQACLTFAQLGLTQSKLTGTGLTVNEQATNTVLAALGGCYALEYSPVESCGGVTDCCAVACGELPAQLCMSPVPDGGFEDSQDSSSGSASQDSSTGSQDSSSGSASGSAGSGTGLPPRKAAPWRKVWNSLTGL